MHKHLSLLVSRIESPLIIVDILEVDSLVIVNRLSRPSSISLLIVDSLVIVDKFLLRDESTITRNDSILFTYIIRL